MDQLTARFYDYIFSRGSQGATDHLCNLVHAITLASKQCLLDSGNDPTWQEVVDQSRRLRDCLLDSSALPEITHTPLSGR